MQRVALVGLGLIGRERLRALRDMRGRGVEVDIVGVVEPALSATDELGDVARFDTLDALLAIDPDWLFVSTPHDVAVTVLEDVLPRGQRVLVEKPLGRSAGEARRLHDLCVGDRQLSVGFNYRFFRGVRQLLSDIRSGWFGELVSLRVALGHGGSPGDDKGWKLDPAQAGGGCLLDPGVHVIDLCRLAANSELQVVGGTAWKGFWRTGIEESVHLLLRNDQIPTVALDLSIVQWRSTFRVEVNGTEGYGVVEGRGRSYGPQTYRRGVRWGWRDGSSQAESEEVVLGPSDEADVFLRETEALLLPNSEWPAPGSGEDAVAAMELLDSCRSALALPVPGSRR